MSDIKARPVLHRQAFTVSDVEFLDSDGVPYQPGTVEKKVMTEDGTILTDWVSVSGFANLDDIDVTADETELQDMTVLFATHIVLIVADRDTISENPLRIQVQVVNREKLPT